MRISGRPMRTAAPAVSIALLLASCVAPPRPVPAPPPPPVTVAPPPAPVAMPVAPAAPGAVEPGVWRYAASSGVTTARFEPQPGSVALSFECRAAERSVTVRALRLNPSAPPTTMTLRASTTLRTLPATGGDAFAATRLAAGDPLLDAIAFSRGRFGVSIDGRDRWFPAWPEVARVIEDCRG